MIQKDCIPTISSVREPCIGDRIESSGDFGTIQYIGVLEGYPNVWYGIDWDNPERGKHDGSVNGIQYFMASHEKSASFVRPEKVTLGRSTISAVTSRYGRRDDAVTAKLIEQELLSVQQCINAPFVTLVGFDQVANKQSDFCSLQIVNLRLQNVSYTGPDDLGILCPNIKELDISKNLLNSWSEIFRTCGQLQHLEWINVSENILELPDNCSNYVFPNLKVLIAGSMRLTWADILQLCTTFPNIKELRVPHNHITHLHTPDNVLMKITLLDLEGNPINDWNEVSKLAVLNTLEQVNLESTGITEVQFEDGVTFRNLKKLVLSDNRINTWESIGELNKLPSLEDLKFLKNPVLETENYNTCIQLIVARLAHLKIFNGATVRSDERRGAEYDYLKKYGLEWLSVKNNPRQRSNFLLKHNRYEELLQKYGTPEESELKVQSKLIKVSLMSILFEHNGKIIEKKVPSTILIQKVNMLAQRLFNLHNRPTLTYVSNTQSTIEIELNDDGKELRFYSLLDGDKIIVK